MELFDIAYFVQKDTNKHSWKKLARDLGFGVTNGLNFESESWVVEAVYFLLLLVLV